MAEDRDKSPVPVGGVGKVDAESEATAEAEKKVKVVVVVVAEPEQSEDPEPPAKNLEAEKTGGDVEVATVGVAKLARRSSKDAEENRSPSMIATAKEPLGISNDDVEDVRVEKTTADLDLAGSARPAIKAEDSADPAESGKEKVPHESGEKCRPCAETATEGSDVGVDVVVESREENAVDEEAEVADEEDEETEEEEESRTLEASELGIVGPPTAVRDLVNDEELGTTESVSSLPNEGGSRATGSRAPDVAEWLENSRRTNGTGEPTTPAASTAEATDEKSAEKAPKRRIKSCTDGGPSSTGSVATRKSQRIITSIIRRSIKCLNKMHAAVDYGSGGGGAGSVKKVEASEKREEDARGSPKVPQSRQNGAALPEETATAMATSTAERLCPGVKRESLSDAENEQPTMPMDCARRRSVDEVAAAVAVAAGSRSSGKPKSGTAARVPKSEHARKRRSTDDDGFAASCGPFAKKICFEQRERFIDSLVGTSDRVTAEELASRADELRAEVQALDEMARAKEMEWNEILSMRKLKEEAYLRIERRRQVVGFMENNGQPTDDLPPASLSLGPDWDSPIGNAQATRASSTIESASSPRESKDCADSRLSETHQDSQPLDDVHREVSPPAPVAAPPPPPPRREKTAITPKSSSSSSSANHAHRRTASPKQIGENGRKRHHHHLLQQQQLQQQQQQQQSLQQVDPQSLDNRQIGEGRQGPIVDVRSIIADYRLRHPETVPRRYENESPARPRDAPSTTSGLINVRRGRRMRNSVNIGLGAGGAMVETTGHGVDSRPSSTDSCKSGTNPSADHSGNSMSFKDVLVQFAKLSQQQGEAVKTPQNYPDVTLHPVAPAPIAQNSVTVATTPTNQQTTGSLLHGILTKSQSPRPTTFSPTLARLLTAPERERNTAPQATAANQHNAQTQHLLQTYQGSSPVSISDLLSSSKARTEITITPVVNPVAPIHTSHSNNLVHVDDVEEDTSLIDDRDSRTSGARDNREERDSPPRCQGCQERAAQFVCAGCGNQWYCSRDCQVAAWDEHSEVCSG